MRIIPVEAIKVGTKLGKTIYDCNGKILLKEGVKLTKPIIERLKKIEIHSVYIEDEYSSIEIEDIIRPEVRQKSIKYLKETFNNIERVVEDESIVGVTKNKLLKKINLEYFSSIHKVAEDIVNEILSNDDILINLVDVKNASNYLYQHSINVAVLSLAMGVSMKMNKDDLIDLALGALLHDIGKLFIDKDIANREGKLSTEEDKEFKTHPKKGYDYIKKSNLLNTQSLLIILQHHEQIDGLGYPNGLKGDKINDLAKIVAIADCYDYLTSDTEETRAISSADALEFIMVHCNNYFDCEYVKIFRKILIAYPKGTIVRLSNDDIAIVESTPANYPLRPKVKILKSKNKERNGKIISLLKELSIVISKVEYYIE